MRSASDHLTRVTRRALPFLAGFGLVFAANGCVDTAPRSNTDAGSNGTGGSSGSGTGGSTSSGTGGTSAGTGGDNGTGGLSGTGGAAGGTGGMVVVGPAIPLPLAVTDVFDNQGWFGDQQEMMAFKPGATLINQAESMTGPCAHRVAGAHGKCMKVVFTPPAGITPATSNAYIGVFFLTTVKANHPEASPAEVIGQANWGATEPGVHIAAGATKISYQVAADTAGQSVAFKAGAGPDSFTIPDNVMTTTTSWQAGSLSLTGLDYGTQVIGGFAWVLTDTTKTVTFYLDDIIWTN